MARVRYSSILIAIVSVLLGVAISRIALPSKRMPLPTPSAVSPITPSSAPIPATIARCPQGCRETFETLTFAEPPRWRQDIPDRSTEFSDDGAFFHKRDPRFTPPQGYRISAAVGQEGFLTLEAYARSQKDPQSVFALVDDPAHPGNHALQLASPEHTDGVLLRTTHPLGTHYQICARIGYINFGTGDGQNGYHGGERNEPWRQDLGDATNENGCYFGAIYNTPPAPHNNIFAHHARIAFIDSDNNTEGWTAIWDPLTRQFLKSGWHPIVMAVLDGQGAETPEGGPPMRAYAADEWNPSGKIVAVDAYKENTWYTACFTRAGNAFTMQVTGDFRLGGHTTYQAALQDTSDVFHYADSHYWLAGDPHINYYEGTMLIDDVTLTTTGTE